MTRRLRGVSRWLALLGAVLVIAAGAIAATASGASRRGNVAPVSAAAAKPIAPPAPVSSRAPLGLVRHPGVAPLAADRPSAPAPVRLTIGAIGVRTALQPLRLLADSSLQSPSRWDRAGWYAGGVYPGQVGPAVIAGHVDSTGGPAVFYRLGDLHPGDRIQVTLRTGRRLMFVVDILHRYPKSRFPTDAVYGPTPDPQLRLITCTGDFDRQTGSYLDNLVVSAHLA